MRKLSFILPVAALAVLGLAQPAAADAPTRTTAPLTGMTTFTGVCAFPVDVTASGTTTQTVFTDRNGNVVRVEVHAVEQDVFAANNKTLTGLPYTYNGHIVIDPQTGAVIHDYATGVVSRVPLPDGDLFLTAGRVDFVAHPDEPFILQPDVGAQGNLAGFCAALAP